MRFSSLLLRALLILGLAAPFAFGKPAPTRESFPNAEAFVEYVRDNWTYVEDPVGKKCQHPTTSYSTLKGDCDDFAVMLAYYLEREWFRTMIVVDGMGFYTDSRTLGKTYGHVIAYMRVGNQVFDKRAQKCAQGLSGLKIDGVVYLPLDWEHCTTWEWSDYDELIISHWSDLVDEEL